MERNLRHDLTYFKMARLVAAHTPDVVRMNITDPLKS